MKKRTPKVKKDQAWFEQKVAELGAALEKLPADRQEQLERELAAQRPSTKAPGLAKRADEIAQQMVDNLNRVRREKEAARQKAAAKDNTRIDPPTPSEQEALNEARRQMEHRRRRARRNR